MPKAAVCVAHGKPLEVMDLVLEEPRAGEIKVEVRASGICGTDLSVQKGSIATPLPIVLGHEGAGVVTAVGNGVTSFAVGDHVAITASAQCGKCFRCARGQHHLCEPGAPSLRTGGLIDGTSRFSTPSGADIRQMVGTGTFAEEIVVPSICAVKIPSEVPFAPASLIGCAVLTGAGAALNAAMIHEGDTVVVLGCGTVGLSALQGARLAGAGEIIAVDRMPTKLKIASEFGAKHCVHADQVDAVSAVRELTGGRGADVTIEAVGFQATVDQAIKMTGPGGRVVYVGAGTAQTRVNIPQFRGLILGAKSHIGVLFGSANIQRDVPRIIDAYQAGEFHLDELVSRSFALDDINESFAALGSGDVISAVVEFPAGEKA